MSGSADGTRVGDISEPASFATGLANDLVHSSSDLVGVCLHGSACLGGWQAKTSDVDLLIVVEDATGSAALETICRVVLKHARHCPGTGIECSVVTRSQAGPIRDSWPYLAHINAPDAEITDTLALPGREDPDLLAHYAVCHQAGIAIFGPPASEVFAPVPREKILNYLADEMIWGLENAPPRYALLNAFRAREFLEHDRIVSKVDAGELALRQQRIDDPLAEIGAALVEQRGGTPMSPLTESVTEFVRNVSRDLRNQQTP